MTKRGVVVDRRSARARSRRTARERPPDPGQVTADRSPTSEPQATPEVVEPEALVVSHWFDSGEDGDPYSATVRLTGRLAGTRSRPRPQDSFVHEESIDGVVPGSGRVSISSWVYGLEPGDWTVVAELARPRVSGGGVRSDPWRGASASLPRAVWSWRRWALTTAPAGAVKTRWALPAPLARIPAVLPGSFPALGASGILVAFVTQAVIAAHESLSVASSLVVSLLALIAGLIAAKVWYAFLHPGPWRQSLAGGWSVDGFLVVAPAVAIAALLALDLPIGPYLDVVAPGLFFAVAIGRVGCFLTGCCAGRCTSSRFGIWSSDRRIGARRIPTQLLESLSGLLIGGAATMLVLREVLPASGLAFVVVIAVYFVERQFLLRLRAERRDYSWRRSEQVARERSA